jgi:1-acyl-sn-glycerol-3-phosphate acyltransferase
MASVSLPRRILNDIIYRATHSVSRLVSVFLLDYRIEGQDNMPGEGPVLVLSNHQSTLDPILVGILFRRKLVYLAKKSLFANPLFGFLIRCYDSIPIDRERGGLDGLREILSKLKDGKAVLIFPEGTRSRDGKLLPMKGGFLPVAKRSQAALLPVAVIGGHEIMQKGKLLPRRSAVSAVVGQPIPFETYSSLSDKEVLALLTKSMQDCWEQSQRLRSGARSTV